MTTKTYLNISNIVAFFCCLLLFGSNAGAQETRHGIRIPESLKGLDIQEKFVPSPGFQEAAGIDAMNGTVVVIHRATGTAYFARPGDPVFENDAIETLEGSRCRIRFHNEDVVTIAAGSRFEVDEYRYGHEEVRPRTMMGVVKGKAMFYALRLFGHGKRDVTVKTPTAVAGVRGTKFGIHVYWNNESAGGQPGIRVAGVGKDTAIRIAQSGDPGQSFTDCFSEDGVLDVNGQIVTPGNMYRGRDGAVVPTPPGFVRAFESETAVQEGEDNAEEPGVPEDETGDDQDTVTGEDDTGSGSLVDVAGLVTDTTLQESGDAAAQGAAGDDIADGKTAGRMSGIVMLLVNEQGYPWFAAGKGPFYSHGPTPIGSGADTHKAYEALHDNEADYRLFLQETDDSGSHARVTEFDWGFGANKALATPRTFTYFKGGSYQDASGKSFLEWGWWEDVGGGADKGKIGHDAAGDFFAATSKIWHVEGDKTHPDYLAYLNQQNASYTYSGDAHGVFVDSTGPTSAHLAGSFSCTINFGSRHISDFNINASGGGQNVHLSGSGNINMDGTFDIDNLSGTLSGHPTHDHPTHAGGAICGAKAEGVAGTWQAHDGGHYWATGEFHGKR